MKKLTALLLVLVMVFSLVTMASAEEFTDAKSISTRYRQAVFAMSDKGVIGGFPDGSFQPKGTLTRAQAAKIICTMLAGEDIPDGTTNFSDVPAGHWAEKYVAYCADKGIVAGVGAGKFNPNGQLTGYAFGKMLLVANGHDAEKEGLTGAGWDTNTAALLTRFDLDYNLAVSNEALPRQEACQLAYNFTLPGADTAEFEKITVSMKNDTQSYRVLGRTTMTDDGLSVKWAGTAIEFSATFGGELTLTYMSDENGYLRVFIDDEESSVRPRIAISQSPRNLKLANNVRAGQHRVRIVRDSDINKSDCRMIFQSVSFNGVKDMVGATSPRDLYIEYVGDSITVGKGVLTKSGTYTDDDPNHAASYGYAYLSAQLLDADWLITARGGIGFWRTTAADRGRGSCPITMEQAYDYVNPFATQAEGHELIPYDFARKPDIVVLALGTNDTCDNATLKAEAKTLVNHIKAKNGSDIKIVVLAGMMVNSKNEVLEEFAKENSLYFLTVPRDNSGGSSNSTSAGHPGEAAQAKDAQLLADYIQNTVLK